MQWSFSLNNFGAHPSASNPGDGSSDVVLVVSLKGKNKIEQNRTKENKKQKKKTPQSVPSSNAIQFQ
jgi:hypothetical protein